MSTPSLNPSFNTISQFSHVAWGYLLVTAPVIVFHIHPAYTIGAVLLGSGIKEYADCNGLESAQVAGSSWQDFAFWSMGVDIAALTLWIGGYR